MSKIILPSHHPFDLRVVHSKLLLADFIDLFCELFDKEVEFLRVIDWKVDVQCEQTHKRQHYLFFEAVVAYLPVDYGQLELGSGLIAFVEFFLLSPRKIVVPCVKVLESVSEKVD